MAHAGKSLLEINCETDFVAKNADFIELAQTLVTFVDESRLFATVQGIGERLLARTGVSFPRSRWPIV